MEELPSSGRRALRLLAFSIGGGIAGVLAMASSSSAQEVVVQDAEVTNVGVAAANSGGNVAVGNTSDNEATTTQDATGLVAANTAETSNSSTGTAVISTGDATAVGNDSSTGVAQTASTDGGGGLTVAVQDADVVNAGAGVANSGLNAAVGNASDNTATTDQDATGLIAVNAADTSNSSGGTAVITTGAATAIGNQSHTGILQAVDTGHGGGLLVAVQDADVVNAGLGIANSGLNLAVGNISDNETTTNQTAVGLLAFNAAGGGNSSDGTAVITTGAATAVGNRSHTGIAQVVSGCGPPGPAVIVQSAPVLNLGAAFANSGFNPAIANNSNNVSSLVQVAFGLIAANVGGGGSWSNGLAVIATGNAWAIGNDAWTGISQTS
jgi:hypothetical protein